MEWIFGAFLVASLLHMGEEYFYPGGFLDVMKRLNPRFAAFVTAPMAVIINGLQLLLCVVAMAVGKTVLAFSMSVAGLLLINGLIHIVGCIREKGYAPGVVTGVVLYIPLSVYAYCHFVTSGELTLNRVILTGALGLSYQAVPMVYLVIATAKETDRGSGVSAGVK